MDEPEQERQRRIEALSALGQSDVAPSSDSATFSGRNDAPASTRRAAWRRVVLLGLVVLVIVGGGSAGYLLLSRQHKTVQRGNAIPATVTIDLDAANLYCPSAYAWSHDGREIAVLATDITCREPRFDGSPQVTKVGIVDARTGKLVQMPTFMDMFDQQHLSVGSIDAVAWAPDDSALILFFLNVYAPATHTDDEALLIYPLKGKDNTPHLLFAPQPFTPQLTTQDLVWNLHTMSAGPVVSPVLPAALTYRWTADGHIVSDQPLPTDTAGPTGRAASNNSFSMWQNGQIVPVNLDPRHPRLFGQAPTSEFFESSPVLWSPDGQFVAFGLRLDAPVTVSQAASGALLCDSQGRPSGCLPRLLSPPDAAFASVLKAAVNGETTTASDGKAFPNWPSVPVQWSPDGTMLLTILPGNEEHENATGASLTVFSAATGKPIKTYRIGDGQPGVNCGIDELVGWSPTGSELAMGLCGAHTLTVLSTQGLNA